MEKDKLNQKRILIFLVITFVITYGIEFFLIAPMIGSTDLNAAMAAQSLIAGVMFAPAVGVILTRVITKEGFTGKDLFFSLNIKKDLKYYGIVWPGFLLSIVAGAALYFLVFPSRFDGNMGYAAAIFNSRLDVPMTTAEVKNTMIMQILVGALISPFVNIVNCFGEEWGWRGYLLPKLLKRCRVVPAVLIDGLIWGLWHAPLIAVAGLNYGVGYVGYPVTGILAMCAFCIVTGISLSYVTIKTQSCIPAILGHSLINGFASVGIYFSSMENPYNVFLGPAPTGLIGGAGFIVLAVYFLFVMYKEEKNSLHFKEQSDTIAKES